MEKVSISLLKMGFDMTENKNSKDFFCNYFMVAFVLIGVSVFSGHALYTIVPLLQRMLYVFALLFAIPIINHFFKQSLNLHSNAFLLMVLMVLFPAIADMGRGRSVYSSYLLVIVVAFGITLVYSFHQFVTFYLKAMTVVSVIALVGYFLVNQTELLEFLPAMDNLNHVEYKVGVVFNYIPIVPDRNCAMFWEPGLFATHLIFSIVLELLFKPGKIFYLRLILFVACLITANSSAGFLLLFLCIFILLFKNTSIGNFGVKDLILVLLFIVGIISFSKLDWILNSTGLSDNEYFAKLLSENVENSSRNLAIGHNMSLFLSGPFFGVGYQTVVESMQHVADTSTSTYALCLFGFLGILYTVFWIWGIFRQKTINILCKVVLSVVVIVILNKEPHLGFLFTWCLFFYLLKDEVRKEYKGLCE